MQCTCGQQLQVIIGASHLAWMDSCGTEEMELSMSNVAEAFFFLSLG